MLHDLVVERLELLDITAVYNALEQVLSVVIHGLHLTARISAPSWLVIRPLLSRLGFGASFGAWLLGLRVIHLSAS